jgi:hypothetical protein
MHCQYLENLILSYIRQRRSVTSAENVPEQLSEEMDIQLSQAAVTTAIPGLLSSLVTEGGRCKYSHHGQPCQTVPHAGRREYFVRHVLNVHIFKEMRRMDANSLIMEDAEILTTPEKLQRTKDYLWHCPSCAQTAMRQDTMKDHIRKVHSDMSLTAFQEGLELKKGIHAIFDILAA